MDSHLIGPFSMWSSITWECSLNFLKYRSWDPRAKAEGSWMRKLKLKPKTLPGNGYCLASALLQSIVRAIHKAGLRSGTRE